MRVARAVAVGFVGAFTVGVMVLGAAAPAGAAPLYDIRDYQQTLPASVIDGGTLSDEERVAWTNGTRAGVIDKPIAPVGTYTYIKSGGGVPLIGGGVGMLMMLDGAMSAQDALGEYWWKQVGKPDHIPQDEWDECSSGGDPSNIFDGLSDWMASLGNMNEAGVDCQAIRDGWDLEKNPDYVPVGTSGVPGGWPQLSTGTIGGTTYSVRMFQPVWDDRLTPVGGDVATRKIGWVYPAGTDNQTTSTTITVQLVGPGGEVVYTNTSSWTPGASTGKVPVSGQPAACNTAQFGCYEFSNFVSGAPYTVSERDSMGLMVRIVTAKVNWSGSNTAALEPMPYVNPVDGSTFSGELARQVLLTTVFTESGNVYQCRTVSFVETAPVVPRPCEPSVPPGEVETERIVELVPETDTGYVPGSNPTRGILTSEVPDVVRDWQRDNDEETLLLLDLELEGVGSCFDNPDDCADWFTDPNKETKYNCTYGGRQLTLAECVKYALIFKPGAITNGQAYPGTGTNPGTTPGGQTSTSPSPSTAPGSQPANPNQPRQCFPTGWGIFNPFEWVFLPVKCAMEWAFVPRNSWVNDRFTGLAIRWQTKAPVVLAMALTQWELAPQVTGCSGILVPMSDVWPQVDDFRILEACGGDPLAPIATLSSIVVGIAACLGALFAASRNLAGIVAYRGLSE